MKVLYVVKPNADSMVAFGIAGHKDGKDSAWGRLFQYVNQHGIQSELNQCAGVQLLYLVGNKYQATVYYESVLLLLGALLVMLGSFWTSSYIHSTAPDEQHDVSLSKTAFEHCLGMNCNGNWHISGPLSS